MKLLGDDKGEAGTGHLIEIAIGLTIFLIVVSYVFAPVGLTSENNINRTTSGLSTQINASLPPTGTNLANTTAGNIWDAIVPIALAALILTLVLIIKKVSE